MKLPVEFEKRMEGLLGQEYEAFLQCYEKERKQGLRVNTARISVEEFLRITPFELTPIPWVKNGFFYRSEDQVTKHPHYFAGLYYVQEPSAMVPASRLPVEAGDRVLDLCAAPGGKATELGAKLHGTGMLVANDVSVSRAGGLLKNIELFGIPNAFVTAEEPGTLLKRYGAFFDKILVDAPCSGEGMFRKDPALIKSWLGRGPKDYAPLQKEILSKAVELCRPGGMILYSTCTFSPEEDEQVIAEILERYPQLAMVQAEGYEGFAEGLAIAPEESSSRFDASKCIRIWPHKMEGEGHFTVLLKKQGEEWTEGCEAESRDEGKAADKAECRAEDNTEDKAECRTEDSAEDKAECRAEDNTADMHCLAQDILAKLPAQAADFLGKLRFPFPVDGKILQKNENLFLLPEVCELPRLRYLRTGLLLGTVKKERFEPSQALAMALRKTSFSNVADYDSGDLSVIKYLKGETLEAPEETGESSSERNPKNGQSVSCQLDSVQSDSGQSVGCQPGGCKPGWVLICCDGYPLGWGKCVNGTIRNKYNPGWRMQ